MPKREGIEPGSIIKWIQDMSCVISEYGVVKVLSSIILLAIAICVFTIVVNPDIIFKKFNEYQEKTEMLNRDYRKQSDPLIRSELKEILYDISADRVSVLEFHNGRKNPSSLGFYYAEMTYEQTKLGVDGVFPQYKSINLSLLNISTILYRDGHWHGSIDEYMQIDQNAASAIKANGTNYIGYTLLEGDVEIGLICVSFKEEPDWDLVDRKLKRSCSKITSWLEYKH